MTTTRVEQVHAHDNTLTVVRDTGDGVTYDPRRLQGITAYREEDRALSVGDRVQFTAPDRTHRVANRDLGTIEAIDREGQMRVRLDAGRSVTVSERGRAHLDYGYAVTSHSSQGQTADRVLVHVETARGGELLVNQRFAYVASSPCWPAVLTARTSDPVSLRRPRPSPDGDVSDIVWRVGDGF